MRPYEIHITGDKNIHPISKLVCLKTIEVVLLTPDFIPIRSEHMTSLIKHFPSPQEAIEFAEKQAAFYRSFKVDIARVKVESPFFSEFIPNSLYMESHFKSSGNYYPISRNINKDYMLGTDRTYKQEEYNTFKEKHKGAELELCLYDTNIEEDKDWMEMFNAIAKP